MEAVIRAEKAAGGERAQTEFEAFVLNEMCQFTGAFCNSLHCDEMGYLCRVPYHLGTINERDNLKSKVQKIQDEDVENTERYDENGYLCGETGCGLCALYRLKEAGITHLKLVGRRNYTDFMENDIRNLRQALSVLEEVTKIQKCLMQKIFSEKK